MEPLPGYPNNINTNKDNMSSKNMSRKKPGRKPNPSSHALRRVQNRVAQRVFRERKQQHVVELEESTDALREECNQLMKENKALYSGIGALGNEGRHLKGLMMSLQLVCLMNNIQIPDHAPYLYEDYLSDTLSNSQESLELISSYKKAMDLHKLQVIPNKVDQKPKTPTTTMSMSKTNGQYVSTGTLLVDQNGVRNVIGNRVSTPPSVPFGSSTIQLQSFQQKEQQHLSFTPAAPSPSSPTPMSLLSYMETDSISNKDDDVRGTNENEDDIQKKINEEKGNNPDEEEEDFQSTPFSKKPIALTEGTLPSFDLVKFQTMRLQLQLQLVCSKVNHKPFKLDPTTLQLKIPHDLRIDLIPISGMRDRMIIFQDNYDLDDCIRCLLDGMVYKHGGDPSKATSWNFPVEFYEKYWFLNHDYSAEEIKKRWPDLNKDTLENLLFQISIVDSELSSSSQHSFSHKNNNNNDSAPLLPEDLPALSFFNCSNNFTSSDKQQQHHYPASLSSEESSSDCLSLREQGETFPTGLIQNTISDINLGKVTKSITIPAENDDYGIPWRTELLTSNCNYIGMYY
ncbi:hypothetical protein BDA99DRAFT_566304 [Phascolomyces articulosus]|uniref:BZIP domain-containing protein n=1 Tax=Phascolomyces articulosus TaxID=60185 RepID=A0AAD5P757_9FUNG|nr:hypothetical protein BDA99DRAFT_566304 [Phascolomyces articulosus]